MKLLLIFAALTLSSQVFSEEVNCRAEKSIQENETTGMKTDADISFTIDREAKVISNLIGHIFVQQVFIENEDIGVYNSYMGFFKFNDIPHNPNYRPIRYKGYTQFKEFDAIHTAGLESGMWGEFVIDLTKTTQTFDARYIFQAGDHMGGTVLFTCQIR